MNSLIHEANRRLLVIDDNQMVHDDFAKVLSGARTEANSVDDEANELFGHCTVKACSIAFEVDSAYQGEDGVERVKTAREEKKPYSVAFVDVRMPPGMDGVETTGRIMEVDPEIQIVLCTAYSDYTLEEIVERFRDCDRLLVLKKPFDVMAASMMAITLNKKWHLGRLAAAVIRHQEEQIADANRVINIVENSNRELSKTNDELRGQYKSSI